MTAEHRAARRLLRAQARSRRRLEAAVADWAALLGGAPRPGDTLDLRPLGDRVRAITRSGAEVSVDVCLTVRPLTPRSSRRHA